ncbi:class I SAM-dependent methyltransferase [Vallitalea guaymasensis]|uniref:S-adenosyl-L-methionine-dependent methyltransferase n=1 Tax=Vallitalea guaymasensis TaxID=1185412 RepID=A0A8J8SAW4_9FIRM|nr:SAM-dependent methyltransferase [Vallitalea guaymasensis]QUH27790.1 class I SAM-dependent methyltransferase [Vallitalea guaymasensis]
MKSITTSEKAAMIRAMEMMFLKNERLYDDQYSIKFITAFNRFFLKIMKPKCIRNWMVNFMDKTGPGVYGGIISRTKYMDDALETAIANKFDAIVNLGGGYDTKCLRFDMKGLEYYHVDQKSVITNYEKIMSGLQCGIPSYVRFVPIDFDTQRLEDELVKAGYSKDNRTLFLWEGVTQYITIEAVIGTLEFIASCSKGSQVTFTYVIKSVLTSPINFPEYSKMLKLGKRIGEEWITGFEPNNISEFLKEHGLKLIEDVGDIEYRERYFKPIGREISIMPIERMAFAEV